jgi:hypothetical protein
MSVRTKARFLSLKRIAKVVWDSENEGAGALNDTILYSGNSILWLVPVPARSKAQVCCRSPAEIASSNPTGGMDVCCKCCVLSGRGLCDELISHPEESCRLWCVVACGLETSRMRRPWPVLGRSATKKNAFLDNRWNIPVLLFPWGSKEIQCRNSRFPIVKNILETITHVGILEQNSTNVGRSRFMTMSCMKRKVVSEVLRKNDVCVK